MCNDGGTRGIISSWHVCESQCSNGCCNDERDALRGNLGPIRRIWARPVVFVYGTHRDSKVTQHLLDAASQLSIAWHRVARGNVRILSDVEWLAGLDAAQNSVVAQDADTNDTCAKLNFSTRVPTSSLRSSFPKVNAVLFGVSGADAAARASSFWKRLLDDSGGVHLEGCAAPLLDVGFMALGPGRMYNGALEVVLSGSSLELFDVAFRLFTSRSFDANSWQMRGPEFAVVNGTRGLADVVAAGHWGPSWGLHPEASFLMCT
eukprot:TRINITY_DN13350_c0_g1_i2.p1 TRINITY_DN13350_c0_g1~~TRINITY_DN13350_c0_g1_i2.p1  ORF type:complete len:262 (-),score=30.27 TRINITY_DN13350_c0_g1_i2:349-1134(-)